MYVHAQGRCLYKSAQPNVNHSKIVDTYFEAPPFITLKQGNYKPFHATTPPHETTC